MAEAERDINVRPIEGIHKEINRIGQRFGNGRVGGFDSDEFDNYQEVELCLNVVATITEGKNVVDGELEVSHIIGQEYFFCPGFVLVLDPG